MSASALSRFERASDGKSKALSHQLDCIPLTPAASSWGLFHTGTKDGVKAHKPLDTENHPHLS